MTTDPKESTMTTTFTFNLGPGDVADVNGQPAKITAVRQVAQDDGRLIWFADVRVLSCGCVETHRLSTLTPWSA
jgi:hypothetical protein